MNDSALTSRRRLGARVFGLAMLAALILGAPEPASSAAPPAKRTYLVIALGLEERYSWQAECLSFTRSQVCTSEGDCGSWSRTEPGPDGELSFDIELGGGEPPARLAGTLRIETRGKREAIGGTARASLGEAAVTVSLTGRSTTPRDCRRQLAAWR